MLEGKWYDVRICEDDSVKLFLRDIKHDKWGFEALINLHEKAKDCLFQNIDIDMRDMIWIDADMCAAFGAILYRLSEKVNSIKLTNINPSVENILGKNGFLSYYGHKKLSDRWGTTIPYRRFDVNDDRYFADYIETELMTHSEIPNMSPKLTKKFQESIFEIFSNAVLHSQTKLGIFSCGQFFPNRNRLDFSIVDLGIGIRQNIKKIRGLDLSPTEAISWATTELNTTKHGSVPGGLGLKILIEFIDYNGGCIQIVSDAGYWKHANKKNEISTLSHAFPGTAVNIEINTADQASYRLASELSNKEIF